ncbi:hypothetical protein ARMGADRAFT_1079573 [Armillaria gallica]|uniref:Uncharacterized protein n=1 Tax=Armillaria gallica TaxID=47427 RepID=A0A2H3E0N2_ARMGA|nr:hypothetical protein ARMGADRAFT_1079573 [Armillaria gallica]
MRICLIIFTKTYCRCTAQKFDVLLVAAVTACVFGLTPGKNNRTRVLDPILRHFFGNQALTWDSGQLSLLTGHVCFDEDFTPVPEYSSVAASTLISARLTSPV